MTSCPFASKQIKEFLDIDGTQGSYRFRVRFVNGTVFPGPRVRLRECQIDDEARRRLYLHMRPKKTRYTINEWESSNG